jgi:hypothetical protein
METGRRFGNLVGDPLRYQPRDVRGHQTAQGYDCDRFNPTGAWAGTVRVYLDGKDAGSYDADPFFIPAPADRRSWLEFFLAGSNNADEDLRRYLRTVPGDKVRVGWYRKAADQHSFRLYYTAGISTGPARLLREFFTVDRLSGTTTAAYFEYLHGPLARGGHTYQVRPTDRAGNEKTGCAVLTTQVAPWPRPPTGVEVHSFVRTTGLVTLKWSHASDKSPTSVYSIYRNSGQDTKVRYATAVASVATAFNLTGTPAKPYATFSLPVTGAAAAGTWLAAVRHEKSGVQEDNVTALVRFVLSSSGSYVPGGYPDAPSYVYARATAGGRIVVSVKHDAVREAAQTLRFRVYRGPNGSPTVNYSIPVGLITRAAGRFFEGSTAIGPLTHGLTFYFGVRSEATGSIREVNTAVATATADSTPPAACASGSLLTKVIG